MLSIVEVWGQNPHQDPLESYFSKWMEKHNLIDLAPKKISHTSSNGRKGVGLVAKQIDLFMISKGLIENQWEIYSRVEIGGLSDHLSIVLDLSKVVTSREILRKLN